MKIALFTDTYLPQMNGVVAYLRDSIGLLSREHEVILFAPGERFGLERAGPRLKIYWIPSAPFPFYEGYRIASVNYKRVSAILKQEKPDIIHAHAPVNLGLQGMIFAKRKRKPLVVTYHTHFPDYVPHLMSGKLPGPLRKFGQMTVKRLIKEVFRMADVVTAPTVELVHELRSYGLQNVIYLPNGIDFRALRTTKAKAESFRKKNGIPKNKVALYLGRMSFEKKVDKLIESFRFLEKEGYFLVLAGNGPYLENFRRFAKVIKLKNVCFTGFVEDVAAAYSCADIFVSASESETFGLTYVEAMYMGLPVVAVGRLGAKDIVESGRTGFLLEPGDTRGFAKAAKKLLSDSRLRGRMSRNARESAKKYSIDNSVRKTIEIYGELLEE